MTKYLAQVIARQGKLFIVENDHGDFFDCHARRNSLEAVCGDQVECIDIDNSTHLIETILPRKNQITRIDNFKREKTVAANVDHMIIVIAAVPEFSTLLIDKYLTCAQLNQCKSTLTVNKAELLNTHDIDIAALEETYINIVDNFVVTSAKLGYGITALRDKIGEENTILVGQSGVGKSSLINRLLHDNSIKIGEISQIIQQGKHTTSNAYAHAINDHGKIIDSPGVRTFMPCFNDKQQVMHGFVEFHSYINHCKFNDCLHMNEPCCEIQDKVRHGIIKQSRYDSYVQIINEITSLEL